MALYSNPLYYNDIGPVHAVSKGTAIPHAIVSSFFPPRINVIEIEL